jgi:esterase/lipase superfamily enzyme
MPALHDTDDLPHSECEIVLFIHGFNSSMDDALSHIGQLWTLGAFPNRLKPIVFGWPGSRNVCYHSALHTVASTRVLDDFEKVLEDVRRSGVKNMHILGHSLGAQIFLNLLRRGTSIF